MIKIVYFGTFISMVALYGCSSNPIGVGTKEPVDALVGCYDSTFVEDGHIYTTLIVSDIVKYERVRQYSLAYFTQYPDIDHDYEATPVAIKYLLVPWEWDWRSDIMGNLHSLHGGGRDAIDERRENIRETLDVTLKNPGLDWLSGLLIHAYGDSYAHTKNDYNSDEEEAYGTCIGHAIPSLFGQSPDEIKGSDENEKKYLAFAADLYSSLKTDDNNETEFDKFISFVKGLKCPDERCPNFHALINEDDLCNTEIDRFTTCMNESMRQLTRGEIQKAMDLIGSGYSDTVLNR